MLRGYDWLSRMLALWKQNHSQVKWLRYSTVAHSRKQKNQKCYGRILVQQFIILFEQNWTTFCHFFQAVNAFKNNIQNLLAAPRLKVKKICVIIISFVATVLTCARAGLTGLKMNPPWFFSLSFANFKHLFPVCSLCGIIIQNWFNKVWFWRDNVQWCQSSNVVSLPYHPLVTWIIPSCMASLSSCIGYDCITQGVPHWWVKPSGVIQNKIILSANWLIAFFYLPQEPVWLNMMNQSSHRSQLCEKFMVQFIDCLQLANTKETNL